MPAGREPVPDAPAVVAEYLSALKIGDQEGVMAPITRAMDAGMPAEAVINDVLAPALGEIGRGWQQDRLSIATEHRATSATESVLQSVVARGLREPNAPRPGSLGRATVLCTEGEWHTLPGRMAAEVLRLRGLQVAFVGPSLPATEIPGLFHDESPVAVVVSCSLPMNLVGAWRTITEVRALGAYTICGGRGFGPGGRWARRLGADRWAASFSTGADQMLELRQQPAPLPREPMGGEGILAEVRLVHRDGYALVEAAAQAALEIWPSLRSNDRAVASTREDLLATLRIMAAATLANDVDLVTEYVAWFEDVIASRRLPLSFVSAAFGLLLDTLPPSLPQVRRMGRAGLEACTQPYLQASV